jgi:hypothetical protein
MSLLKRISSLLLIFTVLIVLSNPHKLYATSDEEDDDDDGNGLTLTSEVINDTSNDYSSLTGFYNINVFSNEYRSLIEEKEKAEKESLQKIKDNIFMGLYDAKQDKTDFDVSKLFNNAQTFKNVEVVNSGTNILYPLYILFTALGMLAMFVFVRSKYWKKGSVNAK